MAKKITGNTTRKLTANQEVKLLKEQLTLLQSFASNETFTMRRELLNQLLGAKRDVDSSCGYPLNITTEDYQTMFDRQGLGTRIVELWPEESWKQNPDIYETEDVDNETEFEKAWEELLKRLPIWNMLCRADILSGISQYGVIFLGIDDGLELSEPANGINEKGEQVGQLTNNTLLYVQPFSEYFAKIDKYEKDRTNPRYGYPISYKIKFDTEGKGSNEEIEVHWTRVIHLADNRLNSEIFGVPRLKRVYNNCLDVKKISGGSGEMFWRGGFPGYSFELSPQAQETNPSGMTDTQKTELKEQMRLYAEGLQRMLFLGAITMKDHAPQVADPSGHLDWHIKLIALALGVPYRILLGTEEAKLAGSQDKTAWNERVNRRRLNYINGMVLRPFIDRLIYLGCLPQPVEYFIEWPPIDSPTENEIADTAVKMTDALSKYAAGEVYRFFPPKEYYTMILKLTQEEAEAIDKAAFEQEAILALEEKDNPDDNNNDDNSNDNNDNNSDMK